MKLVDPDDLTDLSPAELRALLHDWSIWARSTQLPPDDPRSSNHLQPNTPNPHWEYWLALAGRGWGKTRTGAEQVLRWVRNGYRRIGIIAPTSADTRDVATEGESGILTVAHPKERPLYEPSKRRLTFPNGAIATLFSAEEPERLRGPQHDAIWCLAGDSLVHTQLGPVPISLIVPSIHKAWTPWGYRRIYSQLKTHPCRPTWTLSLQSGKMITGTSDHLCYERGSFTQLGNLRCATSVKSIEESFTTLDRTEDTREGSSTWLTWSMKLRLAQYLPGMKFIIKTSTGRMIQWKIWKHYLKLSTLKYTLSLAVDSPSLDTLRQRKSNAPAFSASQSSWPRIGEVEELDRSSAQGNAWKAGERLGSLLKNVSAKFASPLIKLLDRFKNTVARNVTERLTELEGLTLTSDPVLSVERSPNQPVYDLGVEGGVFFANGVLVHNCDEMAGWQYPQETWDMAMFGLRLGQHPQVFISTTPKPIPLIRSLILRSQKEPEKVVLTTGSTYENRANLASTFFTQVAQYEGTRLGDQELHAKIIDPRESGIIRPNWFKLFPSSLPLPKFEIILQSYDTAFTEKTQDRKTKDPDPSAQTSWGVFHIPPSIRTLYSIPNHIQYGALLLDAWTDHLSYPNLREKVQKEYRDSYYGPKGDERRADVVLIEDKGSGISLRQDLALAVPVRPYNPGRADKVQRLHAVSNLPCQGVIFVPESKHTKGKPTDWADLVIDQVCSFPLVENDDIVDTFSQALQYLKDQGWLVIDPPEEEDDDYVPERRVGNPYAR